jgi:glucose-1-phosphate thymidylyltransferase
MKAVILAAAFDSGLNSEGKSVPRILLDLSEEPLILLLFKKLKDIPNIEKIYILTNTVYKPLIEEYRRQLSQYQIPFEITDDGIQKPEAMLGAIGDLLFCIKKNNITDDLLVVGGDNWFTFNLNSFVSRSIEKSPSVAIVPYRVRIQKSRFGLVQLDATGKITDYVEKPESSNLSLKASCVYYFNREELHWLYDFEQIHSTQCSPGVFYHWLCKQTSVYGIKMDANFFDIGKDNITPGPDLIEIQDLIRKKLGFHLTWEKHAATVCQTASSVDDIIDFLSHNDTNVRILAAELLGAGRSLYDKQIEKIIIEALLNCLADDSMNEYQYASWQEDEDDIVVMAPTAARALCNLGYAPTIQKAFEKARSEGYKIVDNYMKY